MQKFSFAGILVLAGLIAGCNGNGYKFDAQGTFETDEVVVSAELTGKILSLNVQEGSSLDDGAVVGVIDADNISLQKEQIEASIAALYEKTADVTPQIRLLQEQLAVQQTRLQTLERERQRTANLVKADAATPKQLDDLDAAIEVAKKEMAVTAQQIAVQRSSVATQNRSILSEKAPLEKRLAQLADQLDQAKIVNPIKGTVITRYAEAGEMTSVGKALYKIANLDTLILRAYITGSQLSQIKLNQPVKVFVDSGAKHYRTYPGTITWISDKAEFTPKTIQTKEERANLVYAVKVRVPNDGYLKIGMNGELLLNENEK
jgi:Multidrug resistance efflux pump